MQCGVWEEGTPTSNNGNGRQGKLHASRSVARRTRHNRQGIELVTGCYAAGLAGSNLTVDYYYASVGEESDIGGKRKARQSLISDQEPLPYYTLLHHNN
jgi:hypothetical protein